MFLDIVTVVIVITVMKIAEANVRPITTNIIFTFIIPSL